MTHNLKTLPEYWHAVKRGEKTFEVRKDDRGFQVGDTLRLFCGVSQQYMEREYSDYRITYMLPGGQFGIEPGYVVLGLGDVEGGAR